MNLSLPDDLQVRVHYLEKVRPFMGKNIIKVFTGQRRVGKSYLLYQLIRELKEKSPKRLFCTSTKKI